MEKFLWGCLVGVLFVEFGAEFGEQRQPFLEILFSHAGRQVRVLQAADLNRDLPGRR